MREYGIIDITGASRGEINSMFTHSCCYYTTAGCKIFVQKFLDGDITVTIVNRHTLEYYYNHHVININEVIDKLVGYNEDLIPYIYR